MLLQRPVARFAVHVRMLAFALYIEDIAVTGFTRLVPGKLYRPCCNLADGSAAVVPVLPKASRNHVMSNDEEDDEGENEESRKSE